MKRPLLSLDAKPLSQNVKISWQADYVIAASAKKRSEGETFLTRSLGIVALLPS
jgi:hypothetical protein